MKKIAIFVLMFANIVFAQQTYRIFHVQNDTIYFDKPVGNLSSTLPPASGTPTTYTTAESYGASTSNTAYNNRVAIQQALNQKGTVTLLTPGTYLIDSTLTIFSNTQFVLGKNTTLVSTGNGTMIVNNAYSTPYTTITLGWDNNVTDTVKWNNHGLTMNNYVFIWDSTNSEHTGVYKIFSVLNNNTFLIKLHYKPQSGPTGTIIAKVADQNIEITGGTFNYNYPTNNSTNQQKQSLFYFAAIVNSNFHDFTVSNAQHYLIATGATASLRFSNLNSTGPYGADFIKISGPAFNDIVENLNGEFNDDVVSLDSRCDPVFQPFEFAWGDVINCVIRNINAVNISGSGLVMLYPSQNEKMYGNVIENIQGVSGTRSAVGVMAEFTNTYLGNTIFNNISANGPVQIAFYSNTYNGSRYLFANQITINGFHINQQGLNGQSAILVDQNTTINNLIIDKADINAPSYPPTGTSYQMLLNNGKIKNFVVENSFIVLGNDTTPNGPGYLFTNSSTGRIDHITIKNNYLSVANISYITDNNSNAIDIDNNTIISEDPVAINNSTSTNRITFTNNIVTASSYGVFRLGGSATYYIYAEGNTINSGTPIVKFLGTPTIYWRSFSIPIDVSLVSKGAGTYAYNTNTALGSLGTAGIVVCDGTYWYLLTNPSAKY
jgi:hypothetical protein